MNKIPKECYHCPPSTGLYFDINPKYYLYQ